MVPSHRQRRYLQRNRWVRCLARLVTSREVKLWARRGAKLGEKPVETLWGRPWRSSASAGRTAGRPHHWRPCRAPGASPRSPSPRAAPHRPPSYRTRQAPALPPSLARGAPSPPQLTPAVARRHGTPPDYDVIDRREDLRPAGPTGPDCPDPRLLLIHRHGLASRRL